MRKFLLLFFAMVCVQISAWAAITISTESVSVGGTTYQGYGIYGAKAGELAQLLSGTYDGIVHWNNGSSLSKLKSAEYIKVGDSQNPNVLKDEDLGALQLLSGAKFLDIDGSTLATGANITSIKTGSAIEAVTLPNNLTKEQVNAAGAALTACNTNFGSCLSLNAEMGPKEIFVYIDPCTSEKVEYKGTVTGGKGHLGNIARPLTLTSASASFVNTKFNSDVTEVNPNLVENGKIVPNPLKVKLTKLDNPVNTYFVTYKGITKEVSANDVVQNDQGNYVLKNSSYWSEIPPYGENIPVGLPVTVTTNEYSYTFRENNSEQTKYYSGTPEGDAVTGYYAMIENNYDGQNGYQFDADASYEYTYTNANCNEETVSYTDGPHETIDVAYNQDVDLETKTITAPVEGGKTTAIAYVNTAGSLYKATSLDANDVKEADALVISGNINNGDISWYGSDSKDPMANASDADSYESNNATVALVRWGTAPESVDLSDAVIDDYRHLRVLRNFGSSLKRVVFPKTVTRIPNNIFSSTQGDGCYNLEEVVFPTEAGSFTIGDNAFKHTAIKSLLLPSDVTAVGNYAFAECPKLYDVEMEALNSDCTFGNYAFSACGALQHVTLSEKAKNIGDYMFNQCGLLESIRIPSTCETIGECAFNLCYSIHQITIPEGVKLIKLNAFENAGLTDIYLMATTPAALPKIYAMSPTGKGPSTFSYQRTTGNNTVPDNATYLAKIGNADYDEVMTWYQEDQSGAEGLGTGNCLTALHYPESMKDFFEGIDYRDFPDLDLTGVVNYKTLEEYLALVGDNDKVNTECLLRNRLKINNAVSENQARDFGTDEEGHPIEYKYLPQSYSIDPDGPTNNDILLVGPDKDGRYYPIQECYLARMAAGATGVNSGGTDGVASQWGWRQFPLSSSIESIGETPFEKEYDDTWYTMCFPWKMEDNQLFMAFNQKCEIVEFVGAEVLDVDNPSTEDVKEYSLVFHFDDVAATYYMDDAGVEYDRERDGDRVDAAGHRLYVYTSKVDGTKVKAPNPLPDKNTTDVTVKEQYGKYLSIQNIMVLPGHPYMIHPSIGAAPGVPAKVYINGVKKIVPGEGLYAEQATFEDVAEANKVERTVSSRTRTRTYGEDGTVTDTYSGPEEWKNPETNKGGKYYFIGNINDEVKDNEGKVTRDGYKDLPKGCYFLGAPEGTKYPKYYKRGSLGSKLWSNYSAIILPDAEALANVEGLNGMTVKTSSGGQAKGATMEIGAWDFNDMTIVDDISPIIDEALEKDKSAKILHMNVVYNIKGQVVRADSGSVEGLPKGIYIVNGKKYMIK